MTTLQPLVSVILPSYNRAHTLRRAIDSVLAQTFRDFELIVVDDGSADSTQDLVAAIADDRLRYVKHRRRKGASAARNTGIDNAKGQYVAFIDSDDAWLPHKLERQMMHVSSTGEAEGRVVWYTQSLKVDGIRRAVRPRRGKHPNESVADYVFCANMDINTITALLRRDLAAEIRFREESRTHEEVDFFMRLESAGARFEFLPEPLSVYYCDPRTDRISSNVNLAPSLEWHGSLGPLFSNQATRGFMAKVVAPKLAAQGKKRAAFRLIVSALLTGSVRPIDSAKYFAECFLSPKMRAALLKSLANE